MDKKKILQMVVSDADRIVQESDEISLTIEKCVQEHKDYITALLSCKELTKGSGRALLAKTPRLNPKRNAKIKAIIEDEEKDSDIVDSSICRVSTASSVTSSDTLEIKTTRSKRGASVKAADNIKKQQSIHLGAKLRKPSTDEDDVPLTKKFTQKNQEPKRTKDHAVSSDDEVQTLKQIKIVLVTEQLKSTAGADDLDNNQEVMNDKCSDTQRKNPTRSVLKRKYDESFDDNTTLTSDHNSSLNEEPVKKKGHFFKSPLSKVEKDSKLINTLTRISEKDSPLPGARFSNKENEQPEDKRITRSSTQSIIQGAGFKKMQGNNIINETLDGDETIASMYEDAVSKMPIMSSTINPTSLGKALNVTVLIEPLKHQINNETISIIKDKNILAMETESQNHTLKENEEFVRPSCSFKKQKVASIAPSMNPQLRLQQCDELITDDESSPERKQNKNKNKKGTSPLHTKRITRSQSSSMSEVDEVKKTPVRILPNKKLKEMHKESEYKQGILFSPYSKESVRKRVEAFEQAVNSPTTDEEAAIRYTRIKTRALASSKKTENIPLTVAQKLVRKSLATARKASLAKNSNETENSKENENSNIPRPKRMKKSSLDKPIPKPQEKTTPLSKNRGLPVPDSTGKSKFSTPSNSQNLNAYSKPTTGSRGNLISHVDSFIQSITKSSNKTIDKLAEERRRRANEEDARQKREELLKAQAEERRRKREEKELKFKLAREAKDKLEHEKRLKAEKEREEKARIAQLMQEKVKEELEKKRMVQLQRVQEKEERRKQEELLRIQRIQEQEEQEKMLAEIRRREQEQEKRKIAEMKMKIQTEKAAMQAKAKALAQKQVPTSYKIDSEPDEDESDDENKPKHPIPSWAAKNERQAQLKMQQCIPMKLVLKFFGAKSCTPDLKDLFHGIDPKKLKRSSSANWKTPPRYSMMNKSIIDD